MSTPPVMSQFPATRVSGAVLTCATEPHPACSRLSTLKISSSTASPWLCGAGTVWRSDRLSEFTQGPRQLFRAMIRPRWRARHPVFAISDRNAAR